MAEADQFLLNAPAYQIQSETHDDASHVVWAAEAQIVKDKPSHLKEFVGDKVIVDLITDGKREFLASRPGQYQEEHGDAAAANGALRKRWSLAQALLHSEEASPATHGDVNGVPATVHAWVEGANTPEPRHIKIWIAEDNHRPLKTEQTLEEYDVRSRALLSRRSIVTLYSYDPTVSVTLPKTEAHASSSP